MNLFFSNKKSKVKYIIDNTDSFTTLDIPAEIFYPIEKQNAVNIGCPATSSLENRLYSIPAFADITIEFGLDNEQPYYNYKFNDSQLRATPDVHNLLNEMLAVGISDKNNVVNFQIKLPYLFVTDDKSIEITALVPNIETKNCTFIPGGFNIYGWIRNINAAWILDNKKHKGKIFIKQGEPLLYVYFNKAVNLGETDFNSKTYKYYKSHSKSVNYVKNITKLFSRVVDKRPKKLL